MAFAKASTALATLEEKLRRALGLAGEIGSVFQPILRPVLISGDLREPGNSAGFNGRSWSWGIVGNGGGATNALAIRFDNDALVLGFGVNWVAAAGAPRIMITVPGDTPGTAAAVATACGTWTDRKLISTDRVPLMMSGFVAAGGTPESDINRVVSWSAQGGDSYRPQMLFMPAGSHLTWIFGGAGGNVGLHIHGRMP